MSRQVIEFPTAASPRMAFVGDVARSATVKSIRLVVAGCQMMFRAGLQALLAEIGGFRVVGEADNGAAGLYLACVRRADVLVVDVPPAQDYDLDFLRRIAAEAMQIRVLLLLSPLLPTEVLTAIRLGAHGVLSKDSAPSQELREALQWVFAGRYWLGDCSVPSLTEALKLLADYGDSDANHRRFGLTPRELQVVPLMVRGYSNREIACALSISIQTVKHHCSHLYDKVGASNRLELALFAIQHRLVPQTVTAMASPKNRSKTSSTTCPVALPASRIPTRLS